jgi:hypothetical protein
MTLGHEEIEGDCFRCECTTVCLPENSWDDGCGKGCDKGGEPCGPKDCGKGGKGCGDLFNLWTCKPRVKKRLLMKKVVACDLATVVCNVDKGKGGDDCDCGGKVQALPYGGAVETPELPPLEPVDPSVPEAIEGDEGIELDLDSDVPEPPSMGMSRRLRRAVPTPGRRRDSSGGLFDLLLR